MKMKIVESPLGRQIQGKNYSSIHRSPVRGVALVALVALMGCDTSPTPSAPDMQVKSSRASAPRDTLAALYSMTARSRIAGRYIVVLADDVLEPSAVAKEMVGSLRGQLLGIFKGRRGFWANLPDTEIELLRADKRVRYIEADYLGLRPHEYLLNESGNRPWHLYIGECHDLLCSFD